MPVIFILYTLKLYSTTEDTLILTLFYQQANVAAPNPLIIRDMPQMTKFVYDFYAKKVAALSEIARPAQSIGKLAYILSFQLISTTP